MELKQFVQQALADLSPLIGEGSVTFDLTIGAENVYRPNSPQTNEYLLIVGQGSQRITFSVYLTEVQPQ